MIFSKLFKTKAKWLHKEAAVRISAVNDELSADNPEQLTILTDLINEDDSELVRRAALIKVGTFESYLAASRDNNQVKVKQFAGKQVHDILATDHNVVLSAERKKTLLAEEEKIPLLSLALLEAWLAHEQDIVIMIMLYQLISARKTTMHLITHSFSQKQHPDFQAYLLNQVDDTKVLEKLSKKACNDALAQQIQDKLTAIKAAAEKPQKLTKQIQLILAKLQALKEVSDYSVYKKRRTLLVNEWQTLTPEFDVFTSEEAATLTEKYQTIITQLEKLFVVKAEEYKQQIISDKLAHDKQQDKKLFSQQLNQISQGITTAVFASEKIQEVEFNRLLRQLKTDINASVLNKEEQQVFIVQVEQLTKRLDEVPEIAESVSQATHLISKISQLTLPKSLTELNDRQQTYHDWLAAWRVVEQKTSGIFPESIVQSQKEIVTTWQSGLKTLQSQQKDLFFQHKKRLQDIKRLLSNGKYKVCFGLFKGVKESIDQLSVQQQQQLQRDFDQVNEKMVELSDWEHYIATPRKQELLQAIQTLVDTPLDNPNEQAAKVKAYRNTWNSLGHADEDIDKQLNEQFNQLCEQAFTPCRLFYAEQDKMRIEHLAQRQKILVKAEQLVNQLNASQEDNTVDFKKLDGQLNNLQQQWNTAGDVDRNQYKKLQGQFKSITSPIKSAISAFHVSNATKKQALILDAQALLNEEDVLAAIEDAKRLQQTWREIGFAGNHQENQLWQQFRQVNDELFAKRQQFKSEQQATLSTQQQALFDQVVHIEATFNDLARDDVKALHLVEQQAQSLLTEVIASKPVIKAVVVRLEKLINNIAQKIKSEHQVKAAKNWSNLFELLTLQAQKNQDIEVLQASSGFNELTGFWQKRLQEQLKLTQKVQGSARFDQTLAIEILGKSDSPAELAEQRLQVQVKLMQEQMLSGAEIDLSQLLVDWLMLGTLSQDDLPLIARLQPIYCL